MFTTPLASRRPKDIPSYPAVVKLPDGGMPLKLALAWLVVCATPMSDQGIPKGYYSPGFLAATLDVVAREAFEVSDRVDGLAGMLSAMYRSDRCCRSQFSAHH